MAVASGLAGLVFARPFFFFFFFFAIRLVGNGRHLIVKLDRRLVKCRMAV